MEQVLDLESRNGYVLNKEDSSERHQLLANNPYVMQRGDQLCVGSANGDGCETPRTRMGSKALDLQPVGTRKMSAL